MKRAAYLGTSVFVAVIALAWLARGSEPSLPNHAVADAVIVNKSERTLSILRQGNVLKTYAISLGGNPEAPKREEGDERTPEGTYTIDFRKRDSTFHRALHISYPNAADETRARELGASPGGAIMIHGMRNGFGLIGRFHLAVDWTDGCIAVTNREMDELWRAIPDGTVITIAP